MKIIIIGNDMDTPQLRRALLASEPDVEIETIASREFAGFPKEKKLTADAAIVARDHGDHEIFHNVSCLEKVPFVVAVGGENIAAGFSKLSQEENTECNQYILYGGEKNLSAFVSFIRYKLYDEEKPGAPEPIAFDSIYTPEGNLYQNTAEYLTQYETGYENYVGIISHRTRWLSGDLAAEYELKKTLNQRGIGVILVFSTANPDEELNCLSLDQTVERFFMHEGKLLIDLMVNFIFFGIALEKGDSLFERAAELYRKLDIPVLRPVQSSYLTNREWMEDAAPFKYDTALSFDISEMQGMIEPIFLGGMKGAKLHDVVPERVEKLAGRIAGWIALRKKANAEKKLVIFLNNAVCSGVEATLGRASDLNTFESVIEVLRDLEKAGFQLGKMPESGETLRKLFLEKKAYSDFRWTAAEDIEAAGGVLYATTLGEYRQFFEKLPEKVRDQMEETWGTAPGEAMVLHGKILITGIRLGNVLLMIQPKRGCYGAKCTGEVCKILQDPNCPPTHQYLAAYHYGAEIFGADAWVHFGTHGSLEFLPGKANGLSGECFSDIAIGEKPNLYIYNAASIASALLAKRRSYGVIVDHASKRDELHVLTQKEIRSLLQGLDGSFILPGEGGAEEDETETGRNLYGVQIDRIPTKKAYKRGRKAAEAMISRYLEEEGRYPEQIVLNMISLDIPRTKGEQISLFLSLIGVTPCWNERGVVTGMDLLPLEELKRPRMDVAVHISSVLRDTWPDVLTRMDEAVLLAAMAGEDAEANYVIRNLKNSKNIQEKPQISRIFGAAPGVYSNSISLAVKSSAWKTEAELGRYFIDSSSYVYGKDKYGEKNVPAFLDGIKRTDLTCDVISVRHTDALASGYSSRIQGGYALAAKSLGFQKKVRSFMGESGADGILIKTLKEHVNDGLQQTFFNGEWKKARMEEGYDGAAEIMCRLQNVFEMQCVNESFEHEILDLLAQEYLIAEEMRLFMEKNNPYAGEEVSRRFLELESRGKWKPAPEILKRLQSAYLKTEAALEDGMSGLGELQGGSIEIVTDSQITEWKEKLSDTDLEMKKWKEKNY